MTIEQLKHGNELIGQIERWTNIVKIISGADAITLGSAKIGEETGVLQRTMNFMSSYNVSICFNTGHSGEPITRNALDCAKTIMLSEAKRHLDALKSEFAAIGAPTMEEIEVPMPDFNELL